MSFQRKIRVLLLGYPYFVNRLAELGRGSEYIFEIAPRNRWKFWWALSRVDLVYQIGGDLRPNRLYQRIFKLKKKLIMHWVGSDILEMQTWQAAGNSFALDLLSEAVHWAEVSWTAKELGELGVNPKIIPLTPTSFPSELKELPKEFVVLTYLPEGKEEFYGVTQIFKLASAFPQVIFLAAATPTAKQAEIAWPANVIPIGWVDRMSELYSEVVLLIRLTKHDGLSFMVLEALAQGRYVFWSYPLDGVVQIIDDEMLLINFNKLYQDFLEKKLTYNQIGYETVAEFYRPEIVWQQIQAEIKSVLSR